ncbi:MAG: hypothetical protein Q8R47_01015 [Nanoarchaeota archaeon]|nr:hypothetical protein [Nanoarchaeota archaeon]
MNEMTSTFLLDLRKLDFSVDAKIREARIEAEAVAYFERSGRAHYAFYVQEVDKENVHLNLLKLSHSEEIASLELRLHYQAASLFFSPFSDALRFQNGSTREAWKEELKGQYEALYVQGKFVKGDLNTFKRYGVAILGE